MLTVLIQCWICVELIWVYFVYPETRGPTLEEIGRIFDGDSAVAHIDMKEVEREIEEREVADEKLPHVAEKRV